ncbi:MAG: hypothetical protein JXA95_17775 [Spirochaetales bacterium]|nr:hypothetical protein [Spirochaetales bacterium]
MDAKDGGFGFDFGGTYTEIGEEEKISYVLGDGRIVETFFENLNGETKITTVFEAESEPEISMD